jgi:TetR/AcrR family transcriptional regulator
MVNPMPILDSPQRPEASRTAILRAAVQAFSTLGPEGARMDAIARAAGVNKALLHYYFDSKEGLHEAVLDEVFGRVRDRALAILDGPGTPGERLLGYFLAHFDRLAQGDTARLMAYEMLRARDGRSSHLPWLARNLFGPIHQTLRRVHGEGVAAGELRPDDPAQVFLALVGMNVFYFMSAPMFLEIARANPLEGTALDQQRADMVRFAASLLFADPVRGVDAARTTLAHHPQAIRQGTRP